MNDELEKQTSIKQNASQEETTKGCTVVRIGTLGLE